MSDEIRQKIYDHVVTTYLSGDARTFTNDTDLLNSRVLDSFSSMQLVRFLQTTFGVQISLEDMTPANLQSVNSLTALVQRAHDRKT